MRMSGQIEVSPGGVGFIRTKATRQSQDNDAQTIRVQRRAWAARSAENTTVVYVRPAESTAKKVRHK